MTKLLASIVFPVLIGLAAAAPVVVPVFFGPGWERTILLVQILAAVGLGKTLGNALGPVLLAKGRADLGFYWVTLVTSVNTAVFWLAVRYGVIVLACSYVAVTAFYLLLWAGLLRHAIDLDPAVYFTTLAIPTGLSLLTGAVVLGARGAFAALGVPAPLALAALVATGAASYLALNLLAQRDYVRGLLELAVRR
jgi:O-antigen/teichoic acid export membrane protein